MAGDNLTIGIGIDLSKLRADKAVVQEQLRQVTAQMRSASKEFLATGDRTKLDQLAKDADTLTGSLARLNTQLRATGTQLKQTGETGAAAFSKWAVSVKEAVAAFAGFEAVRKVVDVFRDVAKEVTEVRNTARAAGMKSGDVQVFQEALRETGESADGSRQALVALTDKIQEARIKMQGLRGAARGVTTLRGGEGSVPGVGPGPAGLLGGVTVLKGSEAVLKDVNELIEKIINNAAKLQGKEGTKSVLFDLSKLMKLDAELGSAVGFQIFGRRWAKIAQAVSDLGQPGNWEKIAKELKDSGRWIDDDTEKRVDAYNRAVDDLGDSFMKLKMAVAIPLFPSITENINQFAELVARFDEIPAKWKEIKDTLGATQFEEAFFGPIRRGINGVIDMIQQWADGLPGFLATPVKILTQFVKIFVDAITLDFSGAIRDFGTLTKTVFDAALTIIRTFADAVFAVAQKVAQAASSILSAVSKAAQAIGQLPGGADVTPPMAPFARGGLVPGRGYGDTVRAWLTPGEFVMRRAVVDRLGANFFARLNRGMGSTLPRSHYATGGLVSAMGATDGATVHLHLDGRAFPMRADNDVADSLIRTARAKQMLSAGRKPGWAGGRRYGG